MAWQCYNYITLFLQLLITHPDSSYDSCIKIGPDIVHLKQYSSKTSSRQSTLSCLQQLKQQNNQTNNRQIWM
jgi:hypothetical protein